MRYTQKLINQLLTFWLYTNLHSEIFEQIDGVGVFATLNELNRMRHQFGLVHFCELSPEFF